MESMANIGRSAAPNAEWVLMYRGGLGRSKISELVGAPVSTVGYHLRLAVIEDPSLRLAHRAANRSKTRVTRRGLANMQRVVAMVRATGRYPSWDAESTSERTLAVWLQRRRRDACRGTLAPAFREGLAVLPDWKGGTCERGPKSVSVDFVKS